MSLCQCMCTTCRQNLQKQMKTMNFGKVELQIVVTCHVGVGEINLGPSQVQQVVLTTETSLQSLSILLTQILWITGQVWITVGENSLLLTVCILAGKKITKTPFSPHFFFSFWDRPQESSCSLKWLLNISNKPLWNYAEPSDVGESLYQINLRRLESAGGLKPACAGSQIIQHWNLLKREQRAFHCLDSKHSLVLH